jgi:hypothetical protein
VAAVVIPPVAVDILAEVVDIRAAAVEATTESKDVTMLAK